MVYSGCRELGDLPGPHIGCARAHVCGASAGLQRMPAEPGPHCGNTTRKLTGALPLPSCRAPGRSSRPRPSPEVTPPRRRSELWGLGGRHKFGQRGKLPPGQEGENVQEGAFEGTGSWESGVQLRMLEGGLEADRLESGCRPVRTQHQGHTARVPAQLQLCFSAALHPSLPHLWGNKP